MLGRTLCYALLMLVLVGCSKMVHELPPPPPPPPPPSPSPSPSPSPPMAPLAFIDPTPMSMAAPVAPSPQAELGDAKRAALAASAMRPWQSPLHAPVSTFSIDVDTGSYSRARQALRSGRLPSPMEVRSEEFLNYFDHGYPAPPPSTPFSMITEVAPAPWNPDRYLLLIGLQAERIATADLPPANLVFLIDTSGSMQSADKLPLLKQGFRSLVRQLRAQDRVAIVSYAGSAGLVLPSTPGDQRERILRALDALSAGGSTNGGEGIELAYRVAQQNFIAGGINRVLLATDGDFNVGISSSTALKQLVEKKREQGVSLSTLGFGQWGYQDSIAEQLADTGNGSHAFIDDVLEARKVLVSEMGGTLLTVAKDVKIQLEFSAQEVLNYRLLGYDNRRLNREDFYNDRIDAGDIGAGHDVTALYELELREGAALSMEALLATLRLRFKPPGADSSQLLQHRLLRSEVRASASPRLLFAAAVVGYAERLRGNPEFDDVDYPQLSRWVIDDPGAAAESAADQALQRAELRDLIELADALSMSPEQRSRID